MKYRDLFRVHVAVVMEILIVHGEASWKTSPHTPTEAGAALDVLTHHQHGVVQHALGALGHRVHADHEYDIDDTLGTTTKTDVNPVSVTFDKAHLNCWFQFSSISSFFSPVFL